MACPSAGTVERRALTRMGDEGAVLLVESFSEIRADWNRETKELYQKNGIAHLLAVSGLHVSFIGLMLYRLMRKAGAPFLAGALVGTLILFPYAVMTGFSVSAKRAVLMYLIRMGAEVSGRVYDLPDKPCRLSGDSPGSSSALGV